MSHRMILGFPFATAITVGLFLLMQSLIQPEFAPEAEPLPDRIIDIIRKPRIEGPEPPIDPPDRPEPIEPPPIPPITVPKANPTGPVIQVVVPTFDPPTTTGTGDLNRTATPIVRIPPEYPFRAGNQEGWVLVEFDITPLGTVQNAVVVDSEPGSLFDNSALKAIKKWKYRPKLIDGDPVFQYGIQQKITYELEGEE